MEPPTKPTQLYLNKIVDALKPSYEGRPQKELLQEVADRLGRIARKKWGANYVNGVLNDSKGVKPGVEFARCVEVLSSELIEGVPALIANAVRLEVYAPPGHLHAGAIVLGRSQPCANPACTVHFVKKTGHQKYCRSACRKHSFWIRKKMKA